MPFRSEARPSGAKAPIFPGPERQPSARSGQALKPCPTQNRFMKPALCILSFAAAFAQPSRRDGQHLTVELKFHMVEPARQITDKAVLMLNLGVQVARDIAQFGLRKARLQSLCTLKNRGDIALGIKQQARTIV